MLELPLYFGGGGGAFLSAPSMYEIAMLTKVMSGILEPSSLVLCVSYFVFCFHTSPISSCPLDPYV